MFRTHPLFQDDAGEGGGGGEATSFDAGMAIPSDALPSELSMYSGKTIGDVFSGVAEMRKTLTEASQTKAQLEAKMEQIMAERDQLKAGKMDPDLSPLGTDDLRGALNEYFTKGAHNEEFFDKASEKGIKMDKPFLAKMMQYALEDQNRYMSKGQDFIEGKGVKDVDFRAIHHFMHSEQSGFSPQQIAAFAEMMNLGGDDMSWLNPVVDRFNSAIERGYQPAQFGETPMQEEPGVFRRGTPVQADTGGFKTQAEYMAALQKAQTSENRDTAVQAVNEKLMKSNIDRWKDLTFGGAASNRPSI